MVTATDGEFAGRGDGPVADLRRLEVVASLAAVGVTDHRWLGSRDGRCAAVPPDDGGRAVRALPEDVRPDTVVTFGRDGPSGRTPASAGGRREFRPGPRTAGGSRPHAPGPE
ncbi:hypothetical protein GCM10027261_38170 [Geodermatophilus arenarius]